MGASTYERSIEIDVPAERLFRFHLDTRNAPLISPDNARFLAIEGDFPVVRVEVRLLRVREAPIPTVQEWLTALTGSCRTAWWWTRRSAPCSPRRHSIRLQPLGPGAPA